MSCPDLARPSRRALLAGGATLALWSLRPRAALAGTRDPRLLVVVLRGGLDGLSLAAPVGDPDYERLRGKLALPRNGEGAGLPLDSFFALNAGMPFLYGLYQRREALVVHATASPYRGRSHFDAQDVLESGLAGTGRLEDGWLNRALAALPSAGRVEGQAKGLSMGAVVPLVMRGRAPVLTWIPHAYNLPVRESTLSRLQDLYAETDPKLAKAFADGVEMERVSGAAGMGGIVAGKARGKGPSAVAAPSAGAVEAGAPQAPQVLQQFRPMIATAEAAAKLMSEPGGPRIGALSVEGWDTHANEGAVKGVLATRLTGLDMAIKAYAEGMGPAWKDTVVVLVTEFGRTARINGTEGTDHGTATTALLLGGAVSGGRVIAEWPGLREASLHEGRDLKPTRDLRAVLKAVLRDHLGVPAGALEERIFPDSRSAGAIDGLVHA